MNKCREQLLIKRTCAFNANRYLCSVGRHNPDRFYARELSRVLA